MEQKHKRQQKKDELEPNAKDAGQGRGRRPFDIPRQTMPEQPVVERIGNFREVPLGFSPEQAMVEASRCIQCRRPRCVPACPVAVDIPGFIGHIAAGRFDEGARILCRDNVLPAICGRVCPQEDQCERACVVGMRSRPVAIGQLERFLADHVRHNGGVPLPTTAPETGRRVAIVGSGPAGLTAAYECRRMGHTVTIHEALHLPGGVLVYGIPEFRLPNDIVAAEVDSLVKMGVELRTDAVVGMSASVDELLQSYDAIFIGTGAGFPRFMDIPGENLNAIYSANEYLTRVNLMGAHRNPNAHTPLARSQDLAVVGGGNVAMDAARMALRLGCRTVNLIYRRSRAEMPARTEEITRAEEEGVKFHLLANPLQYLADADGRVRGVECVRMELGMPDASGRRRPEPIPGSQFTIPVDTVVVAIGNEPNPLIPRTTHRLAVDPRRGTIIADPLNGRTNIPGLFAGGDVVLGAATVILAMGMGRRAAHGIDEYLKTGQW